MKNIEIYCDEYDFSPLENAFCGEFNSDCTLAVEIVIVNAEEIKALNAQTRKVDAVTDVLSFPTMDGLLGGKIEKALHSEDVDENGNLVLGSIAICKTKAEEQAAEYGHGVKREMFYLATHGICHLLGYDHMTEQDKKIMRETEERVLKRINVGRGDE